MFKKVAIALVLVVASVFTFAPQEASATDGLFARLLGNRLVQRQRVVQRVVVPRQVQRVVVDNHAFVQRQVVVNKQRNLRIVEVPNLNVNRDLIVVRDNHGRVLDVRRQNVIQVQKNRKQGNKIIIERNVNRGY